MKIMNWQKALEVVNFDPSLGVRMAPVTTDPIFRMFISEILPGKKALAQYHYDGTEIYLIMQGSGILYTATPVQDNTSCENIKATEVIAGDCFNIYPGIAHQLENTGKKSLIFMFGCPVTHLSLDKVVVADLAGASTFS